MMLGVVLMWWDAEGLLSCCLAWWGDKLGLRMKIHKLKGCQWVFKTETCYNLWWESLQWRTLALDLATGGAILKSR